MKASSYVKKIIDFDDNTLKIYARLWQFETWLRRMVYVERRAQEGDAWSVGLKSTSDIQSEDKAFTHMETPETNDLSYAQLWQLLELIDQNWRLFEKYFPPKKVWKAKASEIYQIRNRIAHFRSTHSDDLQRIESFLRDIDKGFWSFCTSFNDIQPALPPDSDAVTKHFLHLDPLPWGEVNPKEWARIGIVDKTMVVGVQVNKSYRPWFDKDSEVKEGSGVLYDVTLMSFDRKFDFQRLLQSTKRLHRHFVTIECDANCSAVRIVLPCVEGADKAIELITETERWARNAVGRYPAAGDVKSIATQWPEYVLAPDDPLTFLCPDMPCSFFNV